MKRIFFAALVAIWAASSVWAQAVRVPRKTVTVQVEDHGANPFDTADDSAAFQRAIDAAGDFGTLTGRPQRPGGRGYILASGITSARDGQVWRFEGARFSVPAAGTAIRFGVTSDVSGATNANPIVVTTSAAHYLKTGDAVRVIDVTGNTNANTPGGDSQTDNVTVLSSTTFSIARTGNGGYAGGGKVLKLTRGQDIRLGHIVYYDPDNAASTTNHDPILSPYPVSGSNPGVTDTGWTAGNVGLELVNCHSGEYYAETIAGFNRGIFANCFARNAHHTQVGFGRIQSCKFGLYIYCDGTSSTQGAQNGWRWYGGRCGLVGSDPNAASAYACYMQRTANGTALYGHKFHGIYFETPTNTAGDWAGLIHANCHSCFFDVGLEETNATTVLVDARKTVIGAGVWDFATAGGNTFMGGTPGILNPSADVTVDNPDDLAGRYLTRSTTFTGSGTVAPALVLKELSDNTTKIFSTRNTANTETNYLRTDGVLRLNPIASASLPAATAATGQIAFDNTTKVLVYSDGTVWIPVNGTIFACATNAGATSTSEVSIIGTSGAQGSKTIPANFFNVTGRKIRVTIYGRLKGNAGSATDTLNLRVKWGSTELASTGALSLTDDLVDIGCYFQADVGCTATGASGGLISNGIFVLGAETDGTTSSNATSGNQQVYQLLKAAAVSPVDLTASAALDVTAAWGTGSLCTITGISASYEVLR